MISSAASCAILPRATFLFREAASLSLWRWALATLEAYISAVWPFGRENLSDTAAHRTGTKNSNFHDKFLLI